MHLLTSLLPPAAQPYAKAIYPFLFTLVITAATALITGVHDPATVHAAVLGLALTGLSFLIPNGDHGPNLLPAALKPYAKALWTGAAALVTAGVGALFGVLVDEQEIRTLALGLVLTALTLGVPNEPSQSRHV